MLLPPHAPSLDGCTRCGGDTEVYEAPKPVILAKAVPTPRTAPQAHAPLNRALPPPSASFSATPASGVRTSLEGSLAPFRGLPGGGRLSVPPPPVFTPSARAGASPGAAVGPTGTPLLASSMAPPRRSMPPAPPQLDATAPAAPPPPVESQRGESEAPAGITTTDATQPLGDDLDGGWAPPPENEPAIATATAGIIAAAAPPQAVVTATPPVSEEEPLGMAAPHAAVAPDAALAAAAGASSDSEDVAPHLAAALQPRQRRSAAAAAAAAAVEPHATQAVDAAVEGGDDEDESDVEPEEGAGGAAQAPGQGARMTRARGVLPTNFNYVSLDPYWQRTYKDIGRPLPPPEAMVTAQPRPAAEAPKQKRGAAPAKPVAGKKKAAAPPAPEAAPTVSTRRAAGLPSSNDVNFFLALDPHWSRVYEKLGGLPEAPPPKPKKKSGAAAAQQAAAKKAAPKKKRADADVDFFVMSDPYWRRVYQKLGLVDADGNRIAQDGNAPVGAAAPKRGGSKKRGAAGDSRDGAKKKRSSAAAAPADVPMDGDMHDEQMYEDEQQDGGEGKEEEAEMPAAPEEQENQTAANVAEEEEEAPMLATQAVPCTQAPAARVAAPAAVGTQAVSAAAAALNNSDVFADPGTLGMSGGYVYGYDTTADVQFFTAGGATGLNFL